MIKLLAKANDDVLSHCRCAAPLASLPGQLDCPWCGCGWLICCSECRRAFTYAHVVEVDTDYKTFVREDRRRGRYTDDDPNMLDEWALWLEESFAEFEVGRKITYLDGIYFDLETAPVKFNGLYAWHEFERLPHLEALANAGHLRATLGERPYWFDRKLPESPGENSAE